MFFYLKNYTATAIIYMQFYKIAIPHKIITQPPLMKQKKSKNVLKLPKSCKIRECK